MLAAAEARTLLHAIDVTSTIGLFVRVLIGLTSTRLLAPPQRSLCRADVYILGSRTWVRRHERGNKQHEMPCHQNLDEYLHSYIDGAQRHRRQGVFFRYASGRLATLTDRPMSQADVFRIIGCRASAAAARTKIECQSLRATGSEAFMEPAVTLAAVDLGGVWLRSTTWR